MQATFFHGAPERRSPPLTADKIRETDYLIRGKSRRHLYRSGRDQPRCTNSVQPLRARRAAAAATFLRIGVTKPLCRTDQNMSPVTFSGLPRGKCKIYVITLFHKII